jgi:uncharacterized protein DUF3141
MGLQETMSRQIVAVLDAWRDARDAWSEQMFFAIYGAPALQAVAGVDKAGVRPMRKAAKSRLHRELLDARIAELKSHIPVGGLREAIVRSLLYIGMARGAVDERGFEIVRRIRRSHSEMPHLSLSAFKALVREQYFMLLIDQQAALAAIPAMLPPERESRLQALDLLRKILAARGEVTGEIAQRLQHVSYLFGIEPDRAAAAPASPSPTAAATIEQRRAS